MSALLIAIFVLVKPGRTRLFAKSRQIAYDVQGCMLQSDIVRLPLYRKPLPFSAETNVGLRNKIPSRTQLKQEQKSTFTIYSKYTSVAGRLHDCNRNMHNRTYGKCCQLHKLCISINLGLRFSECNINFLKKNAVIITDVLYGWKMYLSFEVKRVELV